MKTPASGKARGSAKPPSKAAPASKAVTSKKKETAASGKGGGKAASPKASTAVTTTPSTTTPPPPPPAAASSSSSVVQHNPVSCTPLRQTGPVDAPKEEAMATTKTAMTSTYEKVDTTTNCIAPHSRSGAAAPDEAVAASSSSAVGQSPRWGSNNTTYQSPYSTGGNNHNSHQQPLPSYHNNHHNNNNQGHHRGGGMPYNRGGGGGFVNRGGQGGGGYRGGSGGSNVSHNNNNYISGNVSLMPRPVTGEDKHHLKMLRKGVYDDEDFDCQREKICTALLACASGGDTNEIMGVFEVLAQEGSVALKLRNWAVTTKNIVIFDLVDRLKYGNLLLENDGLCELVLKVLGKCLDSAADNHALRTSIGTLRGWISSGTCTTIVEELWARVMELANHTNKQELGRRCQGHESGNKSTSTTTISRHHREDDGKLIMYDLDIFPDVAELLKVVDKKEAISQLYSVDTVPFSSLTVHFDTQYQLLRADFALNFCQGFRLAYDTLRNPHRGRHERNMSARVYTEVVLAPCAFSLDRFKGITFTFIVDWRQFGPNVNRVNAKKRFMDGNLIVVSPNFTSNNPELHMGVVVNISEKDRTVMSLKAHQVPFRVAFNKPFFKFVEGSVDYKFTVVESSDFFLATHAVLNVLKTADPKEVPLPIVEALRGVKTEVPAYIATNPFLFVDSAIAQDEDDNHVLQTLREDLRGRHCDELFADMEKSINDMNTAPATAVVEEEGNVIRAARIKRISECQDSALRRFHNDVLAPWMIIFQQSSYRSTIRSEIESVKGRVFKLGVPVASSSVLLDTGIPNAIAAIDNLFPAAYSKLKSDIEEGKHNTSLGNLSSSERRWGSSSRHVHPRQHDALTAALMVHGNAILRESLEKEMMRLRDARTNLRHSQAWFEENAIEHLIATKIKAIPKWKGEEVVDAGENAATPPPPSFGEALWNWLHYHEAVTVTSSLLEDNASSSSVRATGNISHIPDGHILLARKFLTSLSENGPSTWTPDECANALHAARILTSYELQTKLQQFKKVYSVLDVRKEKYWKSLSSWSPALEASLTEKGSTLPVQKVHALDHTQAAGMRTIFNNNVAIVQGTPGTGKTFIGAKFVQLLLDNNVKCGPILVLCFTNHALDSFLHSLIPLTANPEEDIVRLGGSSKDEEMKKYGLIRRLQGLPWDYRIRELGEVVQRISDFSNPHMAGDALRQLVDFRDSSIITFLENVLRPWITLYKKSSSLQYVINELDDAKLMLGDLGVDIGDRGDLGEAINTYKSKIADTDQYLKFQEESLSRIEQRITEQVKLIHTSSSAPPRNPGWRKKWYNNGGRGGGEGAADVARRVLSVLKEQQKSLKEAIQHWKQDSTSKHEFIETLQALHKELPILFSRQYELREWFDENNEKPLLNVKGADWPMSVGEDEKCDIDEEWWLTWLNYGGAHNAKSRLVTATTDDSISQNNADCGDSNNVDEDDHPADNDRIEDVIAGEAAAAREAEDDDETNDELVGATGKNLTDIPDNLLALARDFFATTRTEWSPSDCATALHAVQILASHKLKTKLKTLCVEVDKSRAELLRRDARQKADAMKCCRIVGATTIGAVRDLEALRLLKPKVVIVEECAEVLESHILASLTSDIQHLVLIGDHLQLKPKVSDFGIEKKGLGMSLMERLVLTKNIPFVTLHHQRRMHPDISELTKNYYRSKVQVEIEDHPSVFVNRASVGGVDPKLRVAWIDTKAIGAVEAMHPGMQSPFNSKEAELSLCIAEYLMHQDGLSPSQITILVPYTGQLMEVMGKARQLHITTGPSGIRIVTIDNFQGEENDVIIVSLTRTSKLGFLDTENRACVCLSRARRGMFILGHVDLLEKSRNKLWTDALQGCRSRGHVFPNMSGMCKSHNTPIKFHNANQLRNAIGPNYGCNLVCGNTQACGHLCRQMCHSTPCDKSTCHEICCRTGLKCSPPRKCDHVCRNKCTDECGPCFVLVSRVLPCGHQVQIPCHADPAEHRCMKDITYTNSDGCQHSITAPCWMWSSKDQDSLLGMCRKRCDRTHAACGHACPLKCHYPEPCPPCLQIQQKTYERCGHTVSVPCSKTPPPCSVSVEGVLSCGHTMKQPCDPELAATVTAKYQCTAPVTKHLDRYCNHAVEAPCGSWTADLQDTIVLSCKHRCGITMGCGHQCESPCHVTNPDTHPRCTYEVVTQLPCGHEGTKACGSATNPVCTVVCGKDLQCGHPCNLVCHPEGTPHEVCSVPMSLHLPCSHILEGVPCHLQYDLEKAKRLCKEPCNFIHACGHTCSGSCGACRGSFHYLDHKKCSNSCGRILPLCGHQCKGSCTKDCPSCTEVCSTRCTHSDCSTLGWMNRRHSCGACTAPMCNMPCEWVCSHKGCTRRCHEECNRDACKERCTLRLRCDHQCAGLCGEQCPTFCVDCFKNKDAGEERDAEIGRFTLLGTLPHTETVAALESYLYSDNNRTAQEVLESTIHTLQCGCTLFISELLSYVESHVSQPKLSALLCPTLACRKIISPSDFRIARVQILRLKKALSTAQTARTDARKDRVISVLEALSSLESQLDSITSIADGQDHSTSVLSWLLLPPREPSEPTQPPPPRLFSKFPPTPQEQAEYKNHQLFQHSSQPVVSVIDWLSRNTTVDRNIYMNKMEEFHHQKALYDNNLERYDSKKSAFIDSLVGQLGGVPKFVLEELLDNILRASELKGQGDSCTSQDTELIDALARRSGMMVDVVLHHAYLRSTDNVTTTIADNAFAPVYDICADSEDDDAAACATQIMQIRRGWLTARACISLHACQSLGGTSTDFDNNQFGQLLRSGQQFLASNWGGLGNAPMPVVVDNRCNESGCAAYRRFMLGVEHARQQQPSQVDPVSGASSFMGVKVRFGFHGTSPDGIPSICCEGFDIQRRSGQVYGVGEYFAKSPAMSAGYARGEAQMLLCVIVEGSWMSTPHPDMIVVNNPMATPDIAFCLPIGVLVYNDLNNCIEFSKGCRAKPRISKVMVENLSREWMDSSVPWNTMKLSKKIADAEDALKLPNPQYYFSQNATTAVEAANLPEGGQNYYQCPQGHIFNVGDCGSVLEGTRCPECGVNVDILY